MPLTFVSFDAAGRWGGHDARSRARVVAQVADPVATATLRAARPAGAALAAAGPTAEETAHVPTLNAFQSVAALCG